MNVISTQNPENLRFQKVWLISKISGKNIIPSFAEAKFWKKFEIVFSQQLYWTFLVTIDKNAILSLAKS